MTPVLGEGAVLLGRYEILARLGVGGMGEVYRARRIRLGDEVAIKFVKSGGPDESALRDRFLREARLAAELRHPHIVTVLDFDLDAEGRPFLVMEYLNGPSVADELRASGPFEVARVARVIGPVAGAIQLAHDRQILHRDLKPSNLVSHRYESGDIIYKIVDFGLANLSRPADETRLTGEKQFLGTVGYAPPEQLRGAAVDARADIYSLGVMVFEMLTGQLPFEGADLLSVVSQHLTAPPPPPSQRRPGIPAWMDRAVLKALEKDPARRWSSVMEFSRALSGPSEATTAVEAAPLSGLAGKYDVGAPVGPGRLGSRVYAGVHRALGHPVAIRTLRRADHERWDAIRTRFLREARTMQIAHPSILQVRDYGEEGDLVYVVTDLLQGSSLRELLNREGSLAWPRVHRFVGQLVDGAAALHAHEGLLGGLSPEIVRVTADRTGERVVVSSAGVCQIQDLLATASERTLRGESIEDPELRYLAPELFLGRAPDARCDIYTLGLLAYEMATGRPLSEAATLPDLMAARLEGRLPDEPEWRASLPGGAAAVVERCLALNPDDRFEGTRDLLAAWTSLSPDSGIQGRATDV
jgi:serine/threonine protein kinase